MFGRAKLFEQPVDEIDARLNREDLALGDRRSVAEVRVVLFGLDERAADVVALKPQRVPEAVRVKRARDVRLQYLLEAALRDANILQNGAHLAVRFLMQLLVGEAQPDGVAQPLLHGLDAEDEGSIRRCDG